jgi:hypothetical protein
MAKNFIVEFKETVCSGKIPKGLRLMITLEGGVTKPDNNTVEKALDKQLGIKLNGCVIGGKWEIVG